MTIREYIDTFMACTSHGWLTWEEGLLLVAAAETTKGPMVEVGSYQGRSAMLLGRLTEKDVLNTAGWLSKCQRPRTLFCIDPWDDKFSTDFKGDEVFRRFQENTKHLRNVMPCRVGIEKYAPESPVEFWYLDGDHTRQGTLNQVWKAKNNGAKVIAVHDVRDAGEGKVVRDAALELLGPWKERIGCLAVWDLR